MTRTPTLATLTLLAALISSLAQAAARAQPLPASGAPAPAATPEAADSSSGLRDSHAWTAVPIYRRNDEGDIVASGSWQLVHFAPRRLAKLADGKAHGAADGVVRPSLLLPQQPERLAAYDTTLYLFFPAKIGSGARPVQRLSAIPTGFGDLWRDEPADRPRSLPDLRVPGALADAVGTRIGPLALLVDQPSTLDSGFRYRLSLLVGDTDWTELTPPPTDLSSRVAGVQLVPSTSPDRREARARLAVVRPEGVIELWALSARRGAEDKTLELSWTAVGERRLSAPISIADAAKLDLFESGGVLLACRRAGDELLIEALDPTGPSALQRLASPGAMTAAIPLDGVARVAILGVTPPAPQATTTNPTVGILEVSAWTGRVLFQGPPQRAGPVTPGDVRLLVAILFGLSAVVLALVLRGGADESFSLPDGFALASPRRRLAATSLDAFAVLAVSMRLMGSSIGEALTPEGILSSTTWTAAAVAIGMGLLMSVVCEAAFGRTPGKFLMGCEVLGLRPGPNSQSAGPDVRAAAVRNLVKWLAPPVAALALLDPSGRHRGETLSRTAVVVRIEDERP